MTTIVVNHCYVRLPWNPFLVAIMKSILLVDDDRLMCESLKAFLGRFGLAVDPVHTFEDGYKRARDCAYSLYLIDLCLGTDHGILLIKQLRALKITSPILVWTAHDPIQFEPRALDAGADAFISKDTAPECVLSRINAQLRREEWRDGWKPGSTRRIPIGRAVLDREAYTLEIDGKLIKLTKRETSILDLLSSDSKRIISPRDLLRQIWGPSSLQTENAVHSVVKRLRKKLDEQCGVRELIENHHGRGFRLRDQELQQAVSL
jgi:two-component system, cell cycle response regulator CtrA